MKIVRTYATSANLGPGFDCLGVCFDLYNEYEFTLSDAYALEGFNELFNIPQTNLIIQSYEKVFLLKKQKLQYIHIKQKTQLIPVSRGLGSSASCIVAGIIMANEVLGGILSKDEMFQIATLVEGHPDNVAPLIYGGFICSFKENDYFSLRLSISEKLYFALLVPQFELSTTKARAVLPKNVLLETAVYNLSHAIMTVKALEMGDFELLQFAKNDLLHEPYRYALIDPEEKVRTILKKYNQLIYLISGAGPSLLLISDRPIDFLSPIDNWQKIDVKVTNKGAYVYEE